MKMLKNGLEALLATVECNYKGTDRQLEEQYIQRLKDTQTLAEPISDLTKPEEKCIFDK